MIEAPFELRNDFARIGIEGAATAGAQHLLDDGAQPGVVDAGLIEKDPPLVRIRDVQGREEHRVFQLLRC